MISRNGKLVDSEGQPIELGATVHTLRDKIPLKIVGWSAPRREGSTGRVHVEFEDGTVAEYFPGVVGAKIIDYNI